MWCFSEKCPSCGNKLSKESAFCSRCGQVTPMAVVSCLACGRELKATSKFCAQCGAQLDPLDCWKLAIDEFARRIEISDLHRPFNPGLVVESGVRAMIFQGGALAATVAAGAYDLNQPPANVNVAIPATAIIVRDGEAQVPLMYEGLRSREDVSVDVHVDVSFRVADAATLNANLMHGREILSVAELAKWLWSQSASGIQLRITTGSRG